VLLEASSLQKLEFFHLVETAVLASEAIFFHLVDQQFSCQADADFNCLTRLSSEARRFKQPSRTQSKQKF